MATPQELIRFAKGPQSPQERIWWDRYSHDKLNAWRQVQDPLADRCAAQIKFTRPSGLLDEVERRAESEAGFSGLPGPLLYRAELGAFRGNGAGAAHVSP